MTDFCKPFKKTFALLKNIVSPNIIIDDFGPKNLMIGVAKPLEGPEVDKFEQLEIDALVEKWKVEIKRLEIL